MRRDAMIEEPQRAALADAAVGWWRQTRGEAERPGPARATLAELRRCRDPADAVFVEGFHRLRARAAVDDGDGVARLARLAFLLAHVREERQDASFPAQLASPSGGNPPFHPLRFRRLLQAGEEDVHSHVLRAVRSLGGAVDVRSLARGVARWDEATKLDWAMDYFARAPDDKPSRA